MCPAAKGGKSTGSYIHKLLDEKNTEATNS